VIDSASLGKNRFTPVITVGNHVTAVGAGPEVAELTARKDFDRVCRDAAAFRGNTIQVQEWQRSLPFLPGENTA
jgi:transketolase C-terminal domain/subunit